MTEYKNYINGQWVDGNEINRNINPSDTADIVGEYARADKAQTELAIEAARNAFPAWSVGDARAKGTDIGPVASVIKVADYDEALSVANDTEFGLSAGICTTSLKFASHFKRHCEAGMIMVNLPTAGVDYHVPFGGRKGSSYGAREQGSYAKEFYTIVKTAYTFAG